MLKCGKSGTCDGVVCCMGCMSVIPGVLKRVVNQVAFFPPRPAGYYISESKQSFLVADSDRLEPLPDLSAEGIQIDTVAMVTRRGNKIYGFHYRRLGSVNTILFSHGNSADIGIIFAHLLDVCRKLRIDVFSYEYSGYGQSSGAPSETDLYADIDAAYSYLVSEQGILAESIVLYGQSVGSAPSIDLAVLRPVGGLILHSAMTSGLGVIRKVGTTHWFDVFQNVVKIKSVNCPVFVIHGAADSEVPLNHGFALYEACPKQFAVEPWWVQEAGHNDIEIVWRSAYFLKLRRFIDYVGSGAHAVHQLTMHDAEWAPYWQNEHEDRQPLLMSTA
eukprot:gnl/TRDRNA2_/TRDRNA2_193865_c0_seq1.p1 gnl/TRDRNA2_/TRDRNA2_193865_c0~~gnl/TRDRNA2_/TRDRNA2_193865_c0_seq1.p1  ORF type:complete len:331 (-),score=38.98 gnl/TRDRNA2_/TRDRNA2_193865_c0_seq1:156-1148(-)